MCRHCKDGGHEKAVWKSSSVLLVQEIQFPNRTTTLLSCMVLSSTLWTGVSGGNIDDHDNIENLIVV